MESLERINSPEANGLHSRSSLKLNTRTDQVGEQNGSSKQTRKARNTMISQSYMKRKMCQFSIFFPPASNEKNVKGFKSESSPNESKNLVWIVKLHTVKASREKNPLHLNLYLGNSLKKGWH